MKTKLIIFFSIIIVSCNTKVNKDKKFEVINSNIEFVNDSLSYTLIKNQCYICHSINSSSHDSIIAPPMAAIKMRYSMMYDDKERFVEAVTAWTIDPKPEKALMRGAVNQFNVMPKQNFKEEDIRKIATYIYENKLEEPDWFDEHQKETHGNGMGQGRNWIKKGN